MSVNYLVVTATKLELLGGATPEEAVQAFLTLHPALRGTRLKVYVCDYIGDFSEQNLIVRHPRPTRPDSPHAKSTSDQSTT